MRIYSILQTTQIWKKSSQRIDACDFPSLCNMEDRFQPGFVTSTRFNLSSASLIDPLNMSIFAFRRMIVAPGFIKSTGRRKQLKEKSLLSVTSKKLSHIKTPNLKLVAF
ncbi:hypothetical protein RHGRI_004944 [Rhododendron griersonianum]|uniref:Uncharacterized protein n=1 Tax=Rhododendron griersonianum TaxID=479676 RepID=A0AAV6LBH0_9ERIC|nr:hypothetical protein RHGRI_004944 [Rhododendron griersonianum]